VDTLRAAAERQITNPIGRWRTGVRLGIYLSKRLVREEAPTNVETSPTVTISKSERSLG